MTAAPGHHIPVGKDPVSHAWQCTRRGPYVETVTTTSTGQAVVVVTCEECNHTDERTTR